MNSASVMTSVFKIHCVAEFPDLSAHPHNGKYSCGDDGENGPFKQSYFSPTPAASISVPSANARGCGFAALHTIRHGTTPPFKASAPVPLFPPRFARFRPHRRGSFPVAACCSRMTTATKERSGGCTCGTLRFFARGEPLRVGLCHCLVCQKAHGAPYLAFAVFPLSAVALSGPHAVWESSPTYRRLYCPTCGSRFVNLTGDEIELPVASFDDASGLVPQYENWVTRRLPWIVPLPVPQFARDRRS